MVGEGWGTNITIMQVAEGKVANANKLKYE